MQKSFLLLPLVALVLTACSSTSPAPVVNAGGSELSPGVMRPVSGTGALNTDYGWQANVQTVPTPAVVNPPVYAEFPKPAPTVQMPPVPAAVKPAPLPQPVAKPKKPVVQDFTIPRDDKNAPIYSQINKGFYNGDSYTVRKGDTMFLIAYIAGKDVKEIARLNNMSEPYALSVGQTLKLSQPESQSVAKSTPVEKTVEKPVQPVEPQVTYTQAPNGTAYGSDGTVTGPIKAGTSSVAPTPNVTSTPMITASAGTTPPSGVRATTYDQTPVTSSMKWQWPTQGRVVAGFSASEGGNKGIDIAGNKGQAVKAAAAGKVVYAGNALQGYGNLIIIKHSDDFLSAYAHNDSINVDEQDTVKAGETIATLGSTGTNSNKLHFEIRYHGKSVDPMRYLPRR